jgi:outer membrane protein TolC
MLQLEEQMARDRLLAADEEQETARTRLARLVGDGPASRDLPEKLPPLPPLPPLDLLRQELSGHPALLAAGTAIAAAEREAELAGQYYDSSMVDLLYIRTSSEENRYGLMLTLPLPVWPEARQHRRAAAGLAMARAARLERDDLLRQMESEVATEYQRLLRRGERLELFQREILPQSRLAREATLTAYRQGAEEFRNLLRAAVYQLENELNLLRLATEQAQSQAMLLFYHLEEKG